MCASVVVPVDLQEFGKIHEWKEVLFLFYWPMTSSFDMDRMMGPDLMRKDPSCLVLRVLHEMCCTVCFSVFKKELKTFINVHGSGVTTNSGQRKQNRRHNMSFRVEEDEGDYLLCAKAPTVVKQLKMEQCRVDVGQENESKEMEEKTAILQPPKRDVDAFLLYGTRLSGVCQIYMDPPECVYSTRVWSGQNIEEFMANLNGKYVIKWSDDFASKQRGIVLLGAVSAVDAHSTYNEALNAIKFNESANTNISIQMNQRIEFYRNGMWYKAVVSRVLGNQICIRFGSQDFIDFQWMDILEISKMKKRYQLQQDLEEAIRGIQTAKSNDLLIATLKTFEFDESSNIYTMTYCEPKMAKSAYSMEFMSIDLPDVAKESNINLMKNMRFQMAPSSELIFHCMMGNGDTVLFIREYNEKEKSTCTKIYSSKSRVLSAKEENALMEIKAQRVHLVAYCESKRLFAILMENMITFCVYQDGGRMSWLSVQCHFADAKWWNAEMQFKALFVEEIDRHIRVWLIDKKNVVRAFVEDLGWDQSKQFELDQDYASFQMLPIGSFLVALKPSQIEKGRIELHCFILPEHRKLEYETGTEEKKEQSVILPERFSTIDNYVDCTRIYVMQSSTIMDFLVGTVASNGELLYHPMTVKVSTAQMHLQRTEQRKDKQPITKLDYLEYMVEKFGSRAAIYYPRDRKLAFHSTFLLEDKCKDAKAICDSVCETVQTSLEVKEMKNFKFLEWNTAVFTNKQPVKLKHVLKEIKNTYWSHKRMDYWVKKMIVETPIQIARGANNQFKLMHNGEDNQEEYVKAVDTYDLAKAIRFGAYDGLIKHWDGPIKVVTSMGKQGTGKSYMLNHLFGTKFDISGGRCTDGCWLAVRLVEDVLYIICDFEGLGSFERTPQEDMLLATFNAAVSNCTIFKCDARFDRTTGDMFNRFQSGVKIMV